MGARQSRANRRPRYASEATEAAVPADQGPAAVPTDKAPVPAVDLRVDAGVPPLAEATTPRLSPVPSIPEDDLCVRVQLQVSKSRWPGASGERAFPHCRS